VKMDSSFTQSDIRARLCGEEVEALLSELLTNTAHLALYGGLDLKK